MFFVFRRIQSAQIESKDILLRFAFAPIAVGLTATVLGVFVGFEKSKFGDGSYLMILTLSVSILLGGTAILIRSWLAKSAAAGSEQRDTTE